MAPAMSFFRTAPLGVELQRTAAGELENPPAAREKDDDRVGTAADDSKPSVASETAGLVTDNRLEQAYTKVSCRLVPLFILVVMANQIDRNNLAYAALTMNRDLNFSSATYGLGAAMFFLSFCVFQIPSNLVMVRVGVRRWLSFLVVGWGCIACLFALIRNAAGFFVLRLLLGMFEAGATPAMWWQLSQFYPQERLVKPYMFLIMGLLLSGIIGSPMAAAFLALDGVGGLKGWQYLFLFEGLPSILIGVLVFFVLPDSIAEAKWLTSSQITLLQADMAESAKHSPPRHHIPRSIPVLLKMAVSNPLIPYISAVGFMISLAGYTFIFFLPIIVNSMLTGNTLGHVSTAAAAHNNGLQAALLTVVPSTVSALVSWAVAYHSQKRKELFIHIAVCLLFGGVMICLFIVVAKASMAGGFVVLSLMAAAVAAATGPTHALVARISSGPSLVVGMPLYNSIASLGGFLGPFATGAILQRSQRGFTLVFIVNGCLVVLCGVMVFMLKFLAAARDRRLAERPRQDWQDIGDALPTKSTPSDPCLPAPANDPRQEQLVAANGAADGSHPTAMAGAHKRFPATPRADVL